MKLHLIGGARPNFMKIAPVWSGLANHREIHPCFVYMAQHRDDAMSSRIWQELGLPEPDHVLNWRPSESRDSVAEMKVAYEGLCRSDRPDMVLVVGDVNSSLAAAMVAVDMNVPLIHLEAGLRCFDHAMPEEKNRIAIDHMASLLLTPSADASENLLTEGIAADRIKQVGNIMVDMLALMQAQIDEEGSARKIGLRKDCYVVVTLHRQSNVDDPLRLKQICEVLVDVAANTGICFVLHPRTKKRLRALGLIDGLRLAGVRLLPPLSYAGFVSLMRDAGLVITDSGGVQEETTCLGVPCLTLRSSTERPVTITQGTNRLVEIDQVVNAVISELQVLEKSKSNACIPVGIPLWDGKTGLRVVRALEMFLLS